MNIQGTDIYKYEQELLLWVGALTKYSPVPQIVRPGQPDDHFSCPDLAKLCHLCSFFPGKGVFTLLGLVCLRCPYCHGGCGGGSLGAWVPEKRSKKPNCENPRETERPEHWKKKKERASGLKRLRNWLQQEVGRICCFQYAHGNWVGKCCGECVWKKGL